MGSLPTSSLDTGCILLSLHNEGQAVGRGRKDTGSLFRERLCGYRGLPLEILGIDEMC